MRENRPYGSEGGEGSNPSRPLSAAPLRAVLELKFLSRENGRHAINDGVAPGAAGGGDA